MHSLEDGHKWNVVIWYGNLIQLSVSIWCNWTAVSDPVEIFSVRPLPPTMVFFHSELFLFAKFNLTYNFSPLNRC